MLSDSLTFIGRGAFGACREIETIVFPDMLTEIVERAFYNCSALRNIYFLGNAPVLGDLVFGGNDFEHIYFFEGSSGFTTPSWMGSQSTQLSLLAPIETWLIQNHLAHDTAVDTPSERTGVPFLISYASSIGAGDYVHPIPMPSENAVDYIFSGAREDITYLVELSKDLSTWTSTGVIISEPDSEGMRTASLNLNDGRCFVRFRFVQDT